MIKRHHIVSAVFGVSLALAAPAFSQTAAPTPALTASHLQAAREVIELTGISNSMASIYAEFSERTGQIVGITRPELKKDMDEVIVSLKPEADAKIGEIMQVAAEIFARRMPESDLVEVAAFFKSPVGQRYNAARTQAVEELYMRLETWTVQTSNFLFERFSQEMGKRGHKM